MSWRAITENDIRSGLNSTEDVVFRENLLASGQTDPFAQISAQVTSLFRDAIRANPSNELDGDATTLPESAIFHAVAIIRQRLAARFSGAMEEDKTRGEEAKAARDYLKAVAVKGSPTVELPGATGQTKQPLPSPAINESPRRDGWRNQDGI